MKLCTLSIKDSNSWYLLVLSHYKVVPVNSWWYQVSTRSVPGQYQGMYAFFYNWKSGVPYSKTRKDSATQAPEKQDRNTIHPETTRPTHSPETRMLSSGRRASSSSPSRKSVLLLNLDQVAQKLSGVQSFLPSRRMESLRDLISLVWLREVTMTRSILWWDFLMILVIPDIVHISFPFIWKIVKG